MRSKQLLFAALLAFCGLLAHAQQPQVTGAPPQALQGYNSKWTNGVAPGFYPTCSSSTCASLVLHIGAGTCFDTSATRHAYAGGTLTMTGSSTNYVYLLASNCSLAQSTTAYPASGAMPIATVTATTTITGIVDDRTWFGGSAAGSTGSGTNIKTCIVTTGDPGASSPVLADDNDSPAQCGNDQGADITITAVACYADTGNPTVTPILYGGSSTSILTGPITCSGGSWVAGTVNGTPTIHAFSSNGATCLTIPCALDSNITTAGGSAKYIVMKYTGTTTGGTASPLAMGTCANHQPCYNNASTLGGITPANAGAPMVSQGASSTPSFFGCILNNGVYAKSANYTLDAAETDNGALVTFNGSSLTATLPNPPTANGWCVNVMNLNSTALTISRNSLTINGGTSNMTLLQYQSATFWTDNSNYFATIPVTGVTTTSVSQTPNSVNGGTFPVSAGVLGTNGSSQPISQTAHGIAGPITCSDSSGSTTTYTCTTTPTFSPAAQDCIQLTVGLTNTGASTLNVNSSSAAPIQKWLGSALAASDLPAGKTQPACYDGTNWQLMTIGNVPSGGGGGLTKICSLTASSVSEIDFKSSNCGATVFTSTYDNYLLVIYNIRPSTTSTLDLQVTGNDGTSYDTTSGHYFTSQIGGGSAGIAGCGIGSSTLLRIFPLYGSACGTRSMVTTAGTAPYMSIVITNPLSSTLNQAFTGVGFSPDSASGSPQGVNLYGWYAGAASFNGFKLIVNTGTFSGTATLYGYQK